MRGAEGEKKEVEDKEVDGKEKREDEEIADEGKDVKEQKRESLFLV